MEPQRIQFTQDSLCQWAGMGDFLLVSPDGEHTLELRYEGEPPHGDSYHKARIDGRAYPGSVWGCMFAFSLCSRYLAFSAMPKRFERATAVVDLQTHRHFVLPAYIYQFKLCWPLVIGEGNLSSGQTYRFEGTEQWLAY